MVRFTLLENALDSVEIGLIISENLVKARTVVITNNACSISFRRQSCC